MGKGDAICVVHDNCEMPQTQADMPSAAASFHIYICEGPSQNFAVALWNKQNSFWEGLKSVFVQIRTVGYVRYAPSPGISEITYIQMRHSKKHEPSANI